MDRLLSPVEQFHALPRQGNFEEKRVLILTEAARLFVEQGAHETSLSDIAALFGISKPALYHYAKSKDDIIAQILIMAREGNRNMLDHLQHSEGSGLEKLRGALEMYGATMTTDVARCLALIQVSTFSEETLAVHLDTHRVLLDGLT
ncbi:MAG: helix-turn-helix domain-containing protein, partial [Pseudomonadota bacterium]|nr:helix-turn-helix domain-containing protein [Pseudomonadota bacterium]